MNEKEAIENVREFLAIEESFRIYRLLPGQ